MSAGKTGLLPSSSCCSSVDPLTIQVLPLSSIKPPVLWSLPLSSCLTLFNCPSPCLTCVSLAPPLFKCLARFSSCSCLCFLASLGPCVQLLNRWLTCDTEVTSGFFLVGKVKSQVCLSILNCTIISLRCCWHARLPCRRSLWKPDSERSHRSKLPYRNEGT